MIASVWRLLIPENELPGFVRDCEQNILPRFKQARGLLFAWLWHRPCVAYADVQIVSIWHSPEEMNQFNQEHPWQTKYNEEFAILPDGVATSYDVVLWIASAGTQIF